MKILVKVDFTDRKKPSTSFDLEVTDTGYVDDLIQKIIRVAKTEEYRGGVLNFVYRGIALYATAGSSVASVKLHYDKARNGGMRRVG